MERGVTFEGVTELLDHLALQTVPFGQNQAFQVGILRTATRHLGLSLGDRACLALALYKGLSVVTTDRAWQSLDVGIKVELIR